MQERKSIKKADWIYSDNKLKISFLFKRKAAL